MFLPFLSSILGILAFLPFSLYLLGFLFLVPLFIFFLRERNIWRLILGTALFRLIFLSGTVYFTLEPILWTEVILIFLGLPISIFLFKKFANKTVSPLLILIFLPFAWTFFDLLQARFSLIPTYIITAGNALGSSPFIGLANVGGFIALTFFVALVNALATAAFLERKNYKHVFLLAFAFIVLLFSVWQISNFELSQNANAYANLPNSINISVISSNELFDADQLEQIKQELSARQSDLIIFPEDIFKQLVTHAVSADNLPLLGNNSTPAFQNMAKELHTNLISSYDTLQGDNNKLKYGSVILFDAQGNITGVHNKNRLTFIGEYWPFGNWQPSIYKLLRKENPEIGDYAIFDQKNADQRGERNLLSATFKKNKALFAAPICLEIHYPNDIQEYKTNGAQFIINQSSNRWISTGLRHYLYLTNNLKKIESVWLGIPIISSGVNDYASLVLPTGQMFSAGYESPDKNYAIFTGNIKY